MSSIQVSDKVLAITIRLEPTEKFKRQQFSPGHKRLYAAYNPDFLLKILLNL
jgi:hypothetical protein